MESIIVPKTLKIVKYKVFNYTLLVNESHYLYAFTDTTPAEKCIDFLSHYKHRYGIWPAITNYLTKEKIEMQMVPLNKREPVRQIRDSIFVEDCTIEYLQHLSNYTNLKLMGVTDFDYTMQPDKIDIHFKGGDITIPNLELPSTYLVLTLNGLYYAHQNLLDDYSEFDILD